jgi:hypothetical protein
MLAENLQSGNIDGTSYRVIQHVAQNLTPGNTYTAYLQWMSINVAGAVTTIGASLFLQAIAL